MNLSPELWLIIKPKKEAESMEDIAISKQVIKNNIKKKQSL